MGKNMIFTCALAAILDFRQYIFSPSVPAWHTFDLWSVDHNDRQTAKKNILLVSMQGQVKFHQTMNMYNIFMWLFVLAQTLYEISWNNREISWLLYFWGALMCFRKCVK